MATLAFLPDDDPLRPVLDAGIYVEPKDRDTAHEIVRQNALVNAIRKYARRCTVFAVPNATRSEQSKLRQHREGALYGACDLVVTWPNGVAFIEMKNGQASPGDSQIDFLNAISRQGHPVAVCRNRDGALRWLNEQGAPVPVMGA